jgi:DNA-binding CsgD family transcriptional regulator
MNVRSSSGSGGAMRTKVPNPWSSASWVSASVQWSGGPTIASSVSRAGAGAAAGDAVDAPDLARVAAGLARSAVHDGLGFGGRRPEGRSSSAGRRERRRVDAREQLRTAHDMLSTMGVDAFAERARRELLATGETVRKRTVEARDELTAQERQVARLARDGLWNPEIGTRLFISPRTVQYHLRKVFTKLDIGSRNQLDRVLPGDPAVV